MLSMKWMGLPVEGASKMFLPVKCKDLDGQETGTASASRLP